jgi:sortase A
MVARGHGELLITAGVVVLLFVVYALFVTDLLNDRRQAELNGQLRTEWSERPTPAASPIEVPIGAPVAVRHIPRLGTDYGRVVLEGASMKRGDSRWIASQAPA